VLGEKLTRKPTSSVRSSVTTGALPSALPFTGRDVLPALGVSGLLLLLGGGALVLGRRRRTDAAALTR
jgi:LPXTG-motif cell wall-anchored protein